MPGLFDAATADALLDGVIAVLGHEISTVRRGSATGGKQAGSRPGPTRDAAVGDLAVVRSTRQPSPRRHRGDLRLRSELPTGNCRRASTSWARELLAVGAGPEKVVAVALDRNADLVAGAARGTVRIGACVPATRRRLPV